MIQKVSVLHHTEEPNGITVAGPGRVPLPSISGFKLELQFFNGTFRTEMDLDKV